MPTGERDDAAPAPVELPVSAARIADALVDNLGGFDAGWAMFRAALAVMVVALERAGESEFPFTSHPQSVWRKLVYGLEDGLRLAAAAAEIEEIRHGAGDELRNAGRRRADIARVLHERAVELARERSRLD